MALRLLRPVFYAGFHLLHKWLLTPVNRFRNAGKPVRRLEIGPGKQRIAGFETLNVRAAPHVDYLADAAKRLPFPDASFDLVYASHVIEHIPWHQVQEVLNEWVRTLKPGGYLEIWLPDGYKLCKLLCDLEEGRERAEWRDGWRPAKSVDDPYRWINGRLLYGMRDDYPSWHKAILTSGNLRKMFEESKLVDVEQLSPGEFRTIDHGWINLGMRGRRP